MVMRARRDPIAEAVVYAHASTDAELKNGTLAQQVRNCIVYASEHGILVVRVFLEVHTDTTSDRPILHKLLQFVRDEGAVTMVLVAAASSDDVTPMLSRLGAQVLSASLIDADVRAKLHLVLQEFEEEVLTPHQNALYALESHGEARK